MAKRRRLRGGKYVGWAPGGHKRIYSVSNEVLDPSLVHAKLSGKLLRIRRYLYLVAGGRLVPGSVLVQTCNDTMCVNPDHATVMTRKMAQTYIGLRFTTRLDGEWNSNATLTERDVLEIRQDFILGRPWDARKQAHWVSEAASRYGVSKCTIREILKGKTWTLVEDAVRTSQLFVGKRGSRNTQSLDKTIHQSGDQLCFGIDEIQRLRAIRARGLAGKESA